MSNLELQQCFADNVRRYRKDWGVTQKICASKIGIDYRHYQELESGRVDPKISMVHKIADGFGVKIGELLGQD